MAGHENIDESQFKGLSKTFNTFTNRGRFNISATTICAVTGIITFVVLKKKLTKKSEVKPQ